MNLKHLFTGINHALGNQKKPIRDGGLSLLKVLYARVEDDLNSLVKKFKNLRPVMLKEIKTALSKIEKIPDSYNIRIFSKISKQTEHDESAVNLDEKSFHEVNKNEEITEEVKHKEHHKESNQVSLIQLAPEEFDKLPYEINIKEKKSKLETFHVNLINAIQQEKEVTKEDNSKIYNAIILMLDEKNILVFQEAIKIVADLAILRDQGITGKYAKLYAKKLFNKFKEHKAAVIPVIKKALNALIYFEMIDIDTVFEIALNPGGLKTSKVKKAMALGGHSNDSNPRVKQLSLEFLKDHLITMNKSRCGELDEDIENLPEKEGESEVNPIRVGYLFTPRIVIRIFPTHISKPLLRMLTKEQVNEVREEAFGLLKEIKK